MGKSAHIRYRRRRRARLSGRLYKEQAARRTKRDAGLLSSLAALIVRDSRKISADSDRAAHPILKKAPRK
jgi:hypothetical protein